MTGEDALFLSKKYTDKTIADAQIGGGSDIPDYVTQDYVDEKTEELSDAITTAKTEAKEYADGIKNDLLNGAGDAYDTLKELGDLIDDNTDAVQALETVAANKVSKENGKGLSTNDFTDDLKGKYDEAYEHSKTEHAPTKLSEFKDILPLKKGGTGLSFSEFSEFIMELLFNADGIVNTVGIGNKELRENGSDSFFGFWGKDKTGTRIECKASTSGNAIVDALTIYTRLNGGVFPSLMIGYDVTPGLDNEGDLGAPDKRWCNIYSATGTISTSDIKQKKDIESLDAEKTVDFIMGLNPVSYKLIDGTSDRKHHGLIAQEVEELLGRLGIDTKDFAGLVKAPKTTEDGIVIEGEYDYFMRYGEFTGDLIKMVQIQHKEIENLKATVAELKNK